MPTLELNVDARGVQTGLAQVTSSSISAAQGITNTVTALQGLNVQSAAFSGARALLDIARIGQDFAVVNAQVGTASTLFQRLTAIIRANPLLTIATVISSVASAMSLFGNRTKDATEQVRRQASELDNLIGRLRLVEARAAVGGGDTRLGSASTLDTLTALRLEPNRSRAFGVGDAARLFGVSEQDFRYALARGGLGESALEIRPRRQVPGSEARFRDVASPNEFVTSQVGIGDVERAGQVLFRDRSLALEGAQLRADREDGRVRQAQRLEEERFRAQDEAQQKALRNMDELIAKGQQFGAVVGDAFFNVASGTQTARQAIAGLVADIGRAASQRVFGQIFGAAFGATATQSSANAGIPSAGAGGLQS